MQIEPEPTPTLMASAPAAARSRTPSAEATLPAITSTSGKRCLSVADHLDGVVGVAVSDVHHQHVGAGRHALLRPLQSISDGRTPTAAPTRRRPLLSLVASRGAGDA